MSFDRLKKKLYDIYSKGYVNHRLILLLDVFLGALSALVAGLLTALFLDIPEIVLSRYLWIAVGLAAFTTLLSSLSFKTYKQIMRFSSLRISWSLGLMTLSNSVLLYLLLLVVRQMTEYGMAVKNITLFFLLFLCFFFIIMVMSRGAIIFVTRNLERFAPHGLKQREKIVIYGVKENSVRLAHLLDQSPDFNVIGYMTKHGENTAYQIDGKPIFCTDTKQELSNLAHLKNIQGVIFPAKRDFLKARESFINDCEAVGLKTYLAPDIDIACANTIARESVRRVRIEDLLLRDTIRHEKDKVAAMYKDKVVMVTGAAGSIGSELVEQIASFGVKQLVLYDNAETPLHNVRLELQKKHPTLNFVPVIGDVRIRKRLDMTFRRFRPDIVLHAAAYKHVPLMEENPCESILVNVVGTQYVADFCVKYGVEKMVMISTDKAVNPTNVMGACKRAAEIYVQSLGKAIEEGKIEGKTTFITTRFGNVLGSQGSVIHLFQDQIANGGPVTVTHPEIVRYFMSIPEACSLVLEASALGKSTQIFVFDMGEEHKIVDLAKRMIRLSGLIPGEDIKIEFTGLRPGEKLYEEVLATDENTAPTQVPKVKIALVRNRDYDSILENYMKFKDLALDVDILGSVRLLKEVVPEYKSANSIFEKLDAQVKNE